MPETAPCPWCEDGGKPFLHKGHFPFFSYSVKCYTCGAQGPHVKFDHGNGQKKYEDIVAPVRVEATELWNSWYEKQHGVEEEVPADEGPLLVTVVG